MTPHKPGSATITATTDKGCKSAKVKVTVSDLHAPAKVVIDQGKKLTVNLADRTVRLTATATAKNTNAITTFNWSTSSHKLVSVDQNGTVTLLAAGKAKVTVTTANGKKATITLTIK